MGVCEAFWNGRSQRLAIERDRITAKRDALTSRICEEISATRKRIFDRESSVVGALRSWIGQIKKFLPADVCDTLVAEVDRLEKTAPDLGEVFRGITSCVGIVESRNELVPLLDLTKVAGQAVETLA
jgi:hypothetical protein